MQILLNEKNPIDFNFSHLALHTWQVGIELLGFEDMQQSGEWRKMSKILPSTDIHKVQ